MSAHLEHLVAELIAANQVQARLLESVLERVPIGPTLTAAEAARVLACSPRTVTAMKARGEISGAHGSYSRADVMRIARARALERIEHRGRPAAGGEG